MSEAISKFATKQYNASSKEYVGHNLGKMAGNYLIAGSGDIASALSATAKVEMLTEILQSWFQDPDYEFDGTAIGENDAKKAIAYARGKKDTKSKRRLASGGAKFAVHTGLTVAGFAAGSVVPGAGNAIGGVGGYVAGAAISQSVTIAEHFSRKCKWLYKSIKGTQGVHRNQAAACLYHCATASINPNKGAADDALHVLLQDEYKAVMAEGNLDRIAARMKSV